MTIVLTAVIGATRTSASRSNFEGSASSTTFDAASMSACLTSASSNAGIGEPGSGGKAVDGKEDLINPQLAKHGDGEPAGRPVCS